MDRRTLLKFLASAPLLGLSSRVIARQDLRVVVAGSGIIGASIAYHLAKSGASVTVIDKLGPASHASRGTFAWLNATWAKQPQHYHALNQEGVSQWKILQQSLNLPLRWGGSLEWFESGARQQKLVGQIAQQAGWGERARMVDADEMIRLEPKLNFHGAQQAAFSENDGAIDPVLTTQCLLDAAIEMGAKVQFPSELTDVSYKTGRLAGIHTSSGNIAADKLVLATGAAADVAKCIAHVDIPQRSTPGIIAITRPMPRLLNRIVIAPGIHMHQRDDGRVVLGEQGGPPQNEAHAIRLAGRPNAFPDRALAAQHAARMLAVATRFVRGISGATIDQVHIGWRPMPLDGHPVLGPSPTRPDVYLAIMHSGVTLAPIVGQLACDELITGTPIERLEPFRPGRNFELVKRY